MIRIGDSEFPSRTAESVLAQTRGHMFRLSEPDYALVFPFDSVARRWFHMLFVPFDLTIVFVVDDEVTYVQKLKAWSGTAADECDLVVELPAGEHDIEVGEEVSLE